MGANPTVYGFSAAEKAGERSFRRIRQGRYEALAYARVNSESPQELRISVLNEPGDAVLRDLSIGIYGVAATRLPDVADGERRYVRFALPPAETRRFDGWIELTLSTRGATSWRDNELHDTATGPDLKIERMEIAQAS